MVEIVDGTGSKFSAQVDKNNHLHVQSESIPVQSVISQREGQAYQVIGERTFVAAATINALHIKNNSESLAMVITFIRMEAAGQTSPTFGAATVWEVGKGQTYGSGGTAVTPINMNFSSGADADVNSFGNDATLTGTFVPIDKWYPKEDNQMAVFSKVGSVVLKKNDTITIRYTTDATAGTLYSRVSFYMAALED